MIEYKAGAVWEGWIDFNDSEGERKKYFVLLSDCDSSEQAFAALTTSRGDKRYGIAARGQSPCSATLSFFRIDAHQEKCFPADTWVEFGNGGYQSRERLERLKVDGYAAFVQALSDERIRSLLNCAKKSEDIVKRDIERIDRALKARAPVKKPPLPAKPPTAPPLFVSTEILAVRVVIGGFCIGCRTNIAGLMGHSDTDLTAILNGEKAPTKDFVTEAEAGIDVVSKQRADCPECAKITSTKGPR